MDIKETKQYLSFKLKDEVYAVDVGQVREILLGIVTRVLELLNVELKAEEVESIFLR